MKKIVSVLASMMLFLTASFAQTSQPSSQPPVKQASHYKHQAKKDATAAEGSTTTHKKKDGSPDKRYKENKNTAAGPSKKDGTPDMRYKKNKEAKKG